MNGHIIFHYPRPLIEGGTAGGKVRPYFMLRAFKQLGYQVEAVTGHSNERQAAIKHIKQEISRGRKFDFVYAESINAPMLLSERFRFRDRALLSPEFFKWLFHNDPRLDFNFFKWLKSQAVPLGLFCRDVHWRFEHYRAHTPWYRRVVNTPLYRYDWMRYSRLVDHLFLPDLSMAKALPGQWPDEGTSALPPGCNPADLSARTVDQPPTGKLKLFYVGGILPPSYDLKPGLDVVKALNNVSLTLCCREHEWKNVQSYYAPIDDTKIHIVHAQGKELEPHYLAADLFLLFWRPFAYWNHTMPIKVLETLGYGLPIVITQGSVAAQFVAQQGTGWVVSTSDELQALFNHLQANPQLVAEKRQHIQTVRERHTWLARAQTAANILSRIEVKA